MLQVEHGVPQHQVRDALAKQPQRQARRHRAEAGRHQRNRPGSDLGGSVDDRLQVEHLPGDGGASLFTSAQSMAAVGEPDGGEPLGREPLGQADEHAALVPVHGDPVGLDDGPPTRTGRRGMDDGIEFDAVRSGHFERSHGAPIRGERAIEFLCAMGWRTGER